MPDELNDSEWKKLREQVEGEQTQAGLTHIAETLADFRVILSKHGFTEHQSFMLVREYFCILMDRFYQPTDDEEEETS